MKALKRTNALLAAGVLFAFPLVMVAAAGTNDQPLEEQVRHALVTIPYYNVFDNLSFRVDNGTVTLFGQVTDPVVKTDAELSVKHIEGVHHVANQIEVLPLSPMDNRIRWMTYRSIYGFPALQRYVLGVVPSIHIIVKNGHVTLTGVVATEQDKQMAYMRANSVPGVFSVTNDLRVEPSKIQSS